jgi:hypothetical protein
MKKFLTTMILGLVLGMAGSAWGQAAATPIAVDPCASNTPRSSAFATITTATTTALVAVSGTTTVFPCQIIITSTSTVTANTVLIEQGTGAACAGGPTALTPTFNFGIATALVAIPIGSGQTTALKVTAANGLCAVTTVGTTPSIGVLVTYIQQ